ncbi:MAG: ferritin-like domain-containing protein [Chloroflexia bacterium]|nr:ferritin-like domain-containing protein [Chloroflexia bacterium]
MPLMESLQDLFVHELKDLYSAENQLIEALPKMAKAASTPELKQGFEAHLEQTKTHAQRIEQIFEELDGKPGGVKCKGMEGLIKEGEEAINEDATPAVKDAALIAAAQRVEHYEIAGYGTARTFAKHLKNDTAAKLLQQTLDEEGKTDQQLTKLAESGAHINELAMQA